MLFIGCNCCERLLKHAQWSSGSDLPPGLRAHADPPRGRHLEGLLRRLTLLVPLPERPRGGGEVPPHASQVGPPVCLAVCLSFFHLFKFRSSISVFFFVYVCHCSLSLYGSLLLSLCHCLLFLFSSLSLPLGQSPFMMSLKGFLDFFCIRVLFPGHRHGWCPS